MTRTLIVIVGGVVALWGIGRVMEALALEESQPADAPADENGWQGGDEL